MDGAPANAGSKITLPDYEVTLRANGYRVLREEGVPEDRLEAEWERLRRTPMAAFEIPSLDELESMASMNASKTNAAE